jgi:hypothetical protein
MKTDQETQDERMIKLGHDPDKQSPLKIPKGI